MADSITELRDYKGNCHCGAVKFSVSIPDLKEVECCDCSLCAKKSIMWKLMPPENFTFIKGENYLTDYAFGKKRLTHKFCPTCGIQIVSIVRRESGVIEYAANVRALMDIEPWSMEQKIINWAKFPPFYVPPPFEGQLPAYEGENLKLYTGSCHCGAVRLALSTPPLPQCEVREDNCSICIRHGFLFVYPSLAQVSITGEENSTGYSFGRKFMAHHFCNICGTGTHSRVLGPPKHIQDNWSSEIRAENAKNFDVLPVNLRILEGVEWDELKVKRDDKADGDYFVD